MNRAWLRRRTPLAAVVLGLLVAFTARAQEGAPPPPHPAGAPNARLAGLEWRFVRVRYHYHTEGHRFAFADFGEPWYIDAPAADQNLTRRVRSVTSIKVGEPIVLALDDPNLWLYPWIYFVESGNLNLTPKDASILREFLLRGGTAMFDDFHGPLEWANLEQQLKKVFPEREIIDLTPPHPVFTCFYKIDKYPQVPGLGSFLAGRSYEKAGFIAHLRTILDDYGRPMLFINWNTDMGDGWEWSNSQDYPGYMPHTADAYKMAINEIVYALTH